MTYHKTTNHHLPPGAASNNSYSYPGYSSDPYSSDWAKKFREELEKRIAEQRNYPYGGYSGTGTSGDSVTIGYEPYYDPYNSYISPMPSVATGTVQIQSVQGVEELAKSVETLANQVKDLTSALKYVLQKLDRLENLSSQRPARKSKKEKQLLND